MKKRMTGTRSIGIRLPIIKEGDDIAKIVAAALLEAQDGGEIAIRDRDVVAITESVVARAQGNYCTVRDIAADVRAKTGGGSVGVVFPILSRNRFAICLRGIALACKKVVLALSYPSDEVGNAICDAKKMISAGVNPFADALSEKGFREIFGSFRHPFTGIDYVEYYRSLVEECGAECEIVFTNRAESILPLVDAAIAADIHTRENTKRVLRENGAKVALGLDDIMTESISGSGFNRDFGLLGSNKSTEEKVKLFPRDAQGIVEAVQDEILQKTGRKVEVMVYGDGAFKDPVGKIWELADPVVSPFFTEGLRGRPNELKIKYLADNDYKDLSGDALDKAVQKSIREKSASLVGSMASQGTTPRQITDLLGSLADLTSGSGDKGTPVVLIQGYFDNFADE